MYSARSFPRKLVIFVVSFAILTVVYCECPDKCHCSLYKTLCSLARLNTLPKKLPSTTQLLKIEFDNITQINTTTGLQNLTHLELFGVNLLEIQSGAFKNMSNLEHLAINFNNIAVLKTNTFKYLEKLYFLNLTNNYIMYLEPETFSGLRNIRILDLSENCIESIRANAFDGVRYNGTIPEEFEYFLNVSIIEISAFKYLTRLTYFRFSCNSKHSILRNYIPSYVSFGMRISSYYNDIEYINRNHDRGLSEVLYLDMSINGLRNLKYLTFKNLVKLANLDLSSNSISKLNRGDFEGLISLGILNINHNDMVSLKTGTFHGLQALEILNISFCEVTTIKIGAFEGLSKLQILDLGWNNLQNLKKFTFSTLRTLKDLKLEGNPIKYIDYKAFSHMRYLKSLSKTQTEIPFVVSVLSYEIPKQFEIKMCNHLFDKMKKTKHINLQRLDNLDPFGYMKIPRDLQVLKTLHLYIDCRCVNSQEELHGVLESVRYVRNMMVTLSHLNSTRTLATLAKFHISTLVLLYGNLKFLNSNNIINVLTLKSLAIFGMNIATIQEGAFCNLVSLRELGLYFNINLTYRKGSFSGLQNLIVLSIQRESDIYAKENFRTKKCLERGTFVGLDNLKQLRIVRNGFTCLKPGAFQGLNTIEEITLILNNIRKIGAGVFGALCKDNFEMSCKNVTLPEYCNNSNALRKLKYLDLSLNNITHIHPQAFISCTNLQILKFFGNRLLKLGVSFLYTPALRNLDMSLCNITNIPNNTFECTPLLSEINFWRNFRMNKIKVDSLLPLKNLENIHISRNSLLYDCETWNWMRLRRVYYSFRSVRLNIAHLGAFSKLNCNFTNIKMISIKNYTTIEEDFNFFKEYIEPIVLFALLILGLVCNSFLLFITLRHSDMRTKQNACVIHLAVVDILSLLLNLPTSYWDVVNIRWEFDETVCKIFIFSKDMMVGVNVMSFVALSVERYLVARNFKNLKKICKSKTPPIAWLLMMTWISAIVTSLPAYLSAVVEVRCLYCPPGNQDYIRNVWTFQLIMYCILPAFAITFFNIKTSLYLRQSIRNIPGEIKDNIRAKNRRTAAIIVLILVLVFLISYLPNYILRVLVAWSLLDMKDIFLPSFFTFCLFFFNTVFNPISLFIMSSKFKSYILRYFPFLEHSQNSQLTSIPEKIHLSRVKQSRRKC